MGKTPDEKAAKKAKKAAKAAAKAAAVEATAVEAAAEEPVVEEKKAKKAKKAKEGKKEKKEKKVKKRKAEEESPKKEKKAKKEKRTKKDEEAVKDPTAEEPVAEEPAAGAVEPSAPVDPQACKCFLGNLDYSIDDDAVREFFKDCGEITDIHWLTDRETGDFKGCGFVEFGKGGAQAALQKAGEELLGRPLKIDLATPKAPRADGKTFPKREPKPVGEKPEGCDTVFMGNLSFDIDDAAVTEFFKDCGEIAGIRWLTDRETGDFKGCGFVQFASEDSVDGAVKLNGEDLMGRGVRLDYSAPKKKW